MQTFSYPEQHCGTAIGRSLLGWYCSIEDFCCFTAAYKAPLPIAWRRANVRIRQELANQEYPCLSSAERMPRLLDDLWPQLWALDPILGDIQAGMLLLRTSTGQSRLDVASRLEAELNQLIKDLMGFLNSPHVLEVLRPASTVPVPSMHSTCCPTPSFHPYVPQFLPAGNLRIILHGILAYLKGVLYPFVLTSLDLVPNDEIIEDHNPSFHSLELCRTFAGVESAVESNPDVLFPCFHALVSAAITCPSSLRMWVWCKLVHFVSQGQFHFEPVKRNLAELWNMPEILTEGFSWKAWSSQWEGGMITVGIGTTTEKEILRRFKVDRHGR